jgi:FKBP-type peptidyl-prolyl cis-trans isomerase 2
MIRKPCKLDTDFQRSISFQRNIEVWIDGDLDTVGKIEKFTTDSVKIDGNHFMRSNCEFWIV